MQTDSHCSLTEAWTDTAKIAAKKLCVEQSETERPMNHLGPMMTPVDPFSMGVSPTNSDDKVRSYRMRGREGAASLAVEQLRENDESQLNGSTFHIIMIAERVLCDSPKTFSPEMATLVPMLELDAY